MIYLKLVIQAEDEESRSMSGKAKSKPKAIVQAKKSNPAKALVLYTTTILVLFAAIFFINRANNGPEEAARLTELPSIVDQPVIGSEQAKVSIIEFGDYKCPACKQWSANVYPILKSQYIDSGQVKLAFINTLFHGAESTLGAIAGEAVLKQNKEAFWEFNEAMFAAQPTSDHDSEWITEQKIAEIANSIPTNIDIKKLADDVTNRSTSPQLDIDTGIVTKYRINQTPTLLINGIKVVNPFDLEEIKSIIDKEIGGARNE
ncbi:thioredoxin domain-containing protein [Cohnella suwonensis]|uniref:Thioredoxin domain-containing protein n=1 Tax=Cohnella suwonensis TaxID=696072 RepID=A0ABW0M2N2_9BACL